MYVTNINYYIICDHPPKFTFIYIYCKGTIRYKYKAILMINLSATVRLTNMNV